MFEKPVNWSIFRWSSIGVYAAGTISASILMAFGASVQQASEDAPMLASTMHR